MSTYQAASNECRVTLEYEDGRVFTGIAVASSLTIEQSICHVSSAYLGEWDVVAMPEPSTWELTLVGIDGAPTITMPRDEYRQQIVEPARTAREWKCDRCGAVWPRAENRCGACGFWRPFVYE